MMREQADPTAPAPAAEEVAEAKEVLASVKKPSLSGYREIYARETVLLSAFPKEAELKLQRSASARSGSRRSLAKRSSKPAWRSSRRAR